MDLPVNLSAQIEWPALAVGAIVAGYWWRVMRMAYKLRRRTGQSANVMPTEPLGKLLRFVWQPIVWIWIAHPFFTAFQSHPPKLFRPLYFDPLLQWPAVLVALLAFAATRICWKRMGKSWRMGINPGEQTALVITGPYAYVRHPIYALSSILMLATMIVVPAPLMIAIGIIHLLLLQWEADREEKYLSKIHGPLYDQYRRSVGRFLPRTFHAYSTSPT